MSNTKCSKCGDYYYVDYSNPNIHYSSKSEKDEKKCFECERYESLIIGEYYQDEKGNYIKKQ